MPWSDLKQLLIVDLLVDLRIPSKLMEYLHLSHGNIGTPDRKAKPTIWLKPIYTSVETPVESNRCHG